MTPLAPITARAVMPDDALIAAYLSDDPEAFWALIAEREPDADEDEA